MTDKIPVNIITGFLGVGKTTAIQALLSQKPAGEKWAVLVNEFGQVGIDQAAFEAHDGVTIKELPGGCICCSLGLPLTMTLVMLIRRTRPDRLIIEPTGIGHPAGIFDTLRGESFVDVLDIRATVCLVDPRTLEQSELLSNETFQDQISLADILILNKTDLAPGHLTDEMEQRAQALFPPKAAVARAQQGRFDIALLDSTRQQQGSTAHQQAHSHRHSHAQPADPITEPTPEPGRPVRIEGEGFERFSCGWIFHPDTRFDLDRLSHWCREQKRLERLKGAFNVGRRWVLINQVLGEQVVSPLAWRRDSRLELIAGRPLDIDALEAGLFGCIAS